MAHTYPIIVNNAIVENNVLGFAVASRTGGNMWGGFGIANLNDDRGYILYSTFFDLTNFDTLSWTKSGSVSQQMWLQNESGQNVATLIDYTNHSNTNATPFNCSNLSGMYRFALYTNTSSSGSSSWSASVRLDSLYVSDNRWYVDAYSNPSNTSTFSGLGSYTDNADVSLQSNPIGGYGFVNWKLKGYTRLEYIQGSGTQYIDTSYKPNGNTKVELDYFDLTNNGVFFGGYNNAWTTQSFGLYSNKGSNGNTYVHYCSNDATTLTQQSGVITLDKGKYYLNGVLQLSKDYVSFECPNTMGLFRGLGYSSANQVVQMKVRYFKIWDNGTLVRDFIPCLRHSDGKIGLLDLVELKFYGNSGSGEFYGAFRYEPTEFDTLEYIESSGTQYIDTNYPFQMNTEIDIKYSWSAIESDKDVLGCDNDGNNKWNILLNSLNGKNRMVLNNAVSNSSSQSLVADTIYNTIITNNGNTTIYQNGELWNTISGTNYISTQNLWLFARNRYGGCNSKAKLYHCKIKNNGTLVRDFVPSRRKDDGVVGLFDMVNNEFYTNSGSGSFIGGNIL